MTWTFDNDGAECRPGWHHATECAPTDDPLLCACGCRWGEFWCLEKTVCDECGHDRDHHMDLSCWWNDACVCPIGGRMSESPDNYLSELTMVKMIDGWHKW